MKHKVPEYTFDPETESGMDIHAEVTVKYANEYRESIKDDSLPELFRKMSELEVPYDYDGPLNLRIMKILIEAADNIMDRNK